MKCFRCGSSKQIYYCESCIQELIAENLKLQVRVKELEKQLEYKPKHMKEDIDDMWKHIPTIDC